MLAKVLGLVVALVVSSSFAVAQYGGGGGTGTGGTGGTPPTYTSRSYANKGAIIGGVAAGVAAAGLLYWRLHKRATVVGCVGQNGNTLVSENNKTYTVTTDKGVDLKPGERVEVSGKTMGKKSDLALKIDKLRKDFGSCKQEVGEVR